MPSLAEIAKMDTKDIEWGALLGGLKRQGSGRPAKAPKRGGTLVGLDVQPGYVAAVEAEVNGIISVKRAGGIELPADVVREGEVLDEHLLAEAIGDLFKSHGFNRRVRVGLANQRTVVRIMELPPLTDRKELKAAVDFQAQDQIPMPLASAELDFHPLGIVQTPNGARQQVVVVAAQRDLVAKLVAAVSAAGLRPMGVDLSAFAMIRALHRRSDDRAPANAAPAAAPVDGPVAEPDGAAAQPPAPAPARTLYLNVGGLTNLAIAEGVTCRFTRTVGGGLESMASALAERSSLPLADARAELWKVDLEAGGAAEQEEAEALLRGGIGEIAGEIRNSLDFHRAQESGGEIDEVVLSGSALTITGFAAALESELGFPVLRRTVALARGQETDGVAPEQLTVAAGLAVEEVAP